MSRRADFVRKPRVSALVPTLGLSQWLVPCLEALRREGGDELEIVLIFQGHELGRSEPDEKIFRMADTVVRLNDNLGFAAANNVALAQARGDVLALVNDDVLVEPGWLSRLLAVFDERPEVASVQGLNLRLDDPEQIDGWGLGFNRYWQAVQLGVGRPTRTAPNAITEIFGVAATAALYRRSALEELGGPRRQVFDERLFAYYEDVELAVRLRAAGHLACAVPQARARHAGSSTGKRLAWGSRQLIYGNRYLVVGRFLGRAFWPRLPWIILPDLRDLMRSAVRLETGAALGILAGLLRAALRGHRFVHMGAPAVAVRDIRHFSGAPWEGGPVDGNS